MKVSNALVLLSVIPSVLSAGHTSMNMTLFDENAHEHDVIEEVVAEVIAEVEATNDSSEVSNEVVYDITSEVLASYGEEDDSTKAILGHITDAVGELEEIHSGDSGRVSDILTEIMHAAFGTEAPTPTPTVKVTEETMIGNIKNTVTGATDSVTDAASDIISSVFNGNLRKR